MQQNGHGGGAKPGEGSNYQTFQKQLLVAAGPSTGGLAGGHRGVGTQ